MTALFETPARVAVSDSEFLRVLGYPRGHQPEGRARELMLWARAWYAAHGQPWVYRRPASLQTGAADVLVDGRTFSSGQLRDHLRATGAVGAALIAVSAGAECEAEAQLAWAAERPDEYFFLEAYGSAVVEHLVAEANGALCAEAESEGLVAVPHFSPGYAGWDVAEQPALFGLITADGTATLPGPLTVRSSGMLWPKKSLLAVVGLAPRSEAAQHQARLQPCERCSYARCHYRRAAFRRTLLPVEGARRGALEATRAYTINERALRRWAAERVGLRFASDGAVTATFRFDGTTCSNLGWPLAFEYRVVLGPAAHGWIIRNATCAPAAGDEGYRRMCAFIADGEALTRAVGTTLPLLGRPLEAVFSWDAVRTPAGCLCDESSRLHKWRVALEVIHYTLAQGAPSAADPALPEEILR